MSKLLILHFVLENKIGDFFNILVLEAVVSSYVRPFSFFLCYKGTIYQSRAGGERGGLLLPPCVQPYLNIWSWASNTVTGFIFALSTVLKEYLQ